MKKNLTGSHRGGDELLKNSRFLSQHASKCCAENTNCLSFLWGIFAPFWCLHLLCFALLLHYSGCLFATKIALTLLHESELQNQRKNWKIMPVAKWIFLVFLAEPNQLWQRTDFIHLNISWATEEENRDHSVSLRSTLLFFFICFYKYFCLLCCCDSVYVLICCVIKEEQHMWT